MNKENLTANEKAYDMGYEDSMKCNSYIPYEDWKHAGSHSAYMQGYQDADRDYEGDDSE